MRIRSLPPIIQKQCRILILGSMPGKASLELAEFYGNRRNHFWPVMCKLLECEWQEDYQARLKMLLDHRIALWDVCESCEREGSLDKDIMRPELNDIPGLLLEYPGIERLVFNGATAKKLFDKQFKVDVPRHLMPSTSPVPRKHYRNFDDIYQAWAVLREWL